MADEAVSDRAAAGARKAISTSQKSLPLASEQAPRRCIPATAFGGERESFPTALARAGIVCIGPNPKAIAAMGDKIESKKTAAKAKVSTVPGHLGVIADAKHAVKIADEIGYPVMIKASAGGGGKGMRVANSKDEVAEGFARARSRRSPPSATTGCSSRNISSIRATSRFRCWATSTAMSFISANANARSSAAIRRSWREAHRARSSTLRRARKWASRRSRSPQGRRLRLCRHRRVRRRAKQKLLFP